LNKKSKYTLFYFNSFLKKKNKTIYNDD